MVELAEIRRRRVHLGRAISVALSVWIRTLPALLLVTAVIHSPLLAYEFSRLGDESAEEGPFGHVETRAVASLATLLLNVVVQGILIHVVIQALRRQPISLATAFRVGLSRLPALIGVGIVVGVTVVLFLLPASLMFLVLRQFAQALYLLAVVLYLLALVPLARWFVAPSVAVVERAGVRASLARSSKLTQGSRWPVAGLVVLQYVFNWGVGAATAFVALRGPRPQFLVTELATLFVSTLNAVLPVVVYQELRLAREGVELEELARVFD